jgi:hypothetical protein
MLSTGSIPTYNDLFQLAPEFTAVATGTLDTYFQMSNGFASSGSYFGQTVAAKCYWTAHQLKSFGIGSGPSTYEPGVVAMTVGPTSITYSDGSIEEMSQDYSKTVYGQKFLQLRKLAKASAWLNPYEGWCTES